MPLAWKINHKGGCMGKKLLLIAIAVLVAAGLFLTYSTSMAQAQKPKIAPPCKQCHAPDEKILRGSLASASGKAETLQIQIGPAVWLVKFDDKTKLTGWQPPIYKVPKEKEIAVAYEEKDGSIYALSISVKQPAKVPEEKKIKTEELTKLIDIGTEKGRYVIVDSRPAPRYHEGHIPGSIVIYDADFDKNIDRLPQEKDKFLIFYCGGVT